MPTNPVPTNPAPTNPAPTNPAPTNPVIKWGDVDGDGSLTIIDATMIQRYLAGIITLTTHQQQIGAVTGNGKLMIIDATAIQARGYYQGVPGGEDSRGNRYGD